MSKYLIGHQLDLGLLALKPNVITTTLSGSLSLFLGLFHMKMKRDSSDGRAADCFVKLY